VFPEGNQLIKNMQKKILFPFIYLFLVLIAFISNSDALFMILTAQMALVMIGVEILFGEQVNTSIYLLFFLEIVQFFIIGAVWDKIAGKFRNKEQKSSNSYT
jgi:hypothetical protein